MKINEKLLKAVSERDVPHTELLALIKPVKGLSGDERRNMQNRIADEINRKYPLKNKLSRKEL